MTSQSPQNILNQLNLDSNALALLCKQVPQASNIIAGSYFIKSWKDIHGYESLHVFYNYNTNSFWAVLQGQSGLEFIPSMKDGFEMITIPFLASKMTQHKLINQQSPFTSPLSLVGFLQKELKYPIIRDSSNGHTIQLNCAGLLGGGAKISRIGIAEVTKQSKVNKDSEGFVQVKRYLINRYKIHTTKEMDTNDEKFVEKLAERICGVTSFDQASHTEKHLIEKNLIELIDVYEEEYIDEIVLDIIKKSIEGGKPQLKDYIGNFCSGRLCIELLRKGYFASERAKGGVSQLIVEKILIKLTEETEGISKKLQQKIEGDDDNQFKPVIFEKLFAMLEMREKINSFLKPLAKIKVKKLLGFVSAQLEIETEDQTEIITEFCCSEKGPEIYDDMTSRFLMMGTRAFSASLAGSPKKKPENQEVSHSERPSRNLDESPEAKKKTDTKASGNDFPYLNRVRLSVLNELNLLDHELGTLVELHNMLKAETVVTDKSDTKGSARSAKNSNLDDIKGLIMSIVRGYRENEANLESHELDSILPLAFIQDPKIFRGFLQVFLEDLSNDILFDAKKVRMMSFILISAMRNPDFKEYLQTDDLIQCLKILKPKIEDLSITSENINIQEAMSSLNDILFLMGFIGAKGVKGDYLEMVKELTKHMQSHGLEKTFNAFTGKAKDPSLDIKREFALESFKRIEGTSFEEWEGNFQNLMQIGNIAMNLGKGIFLSDMSSISEALLQIADLVVQAYANKPKCWYDHANDLRFLAFEPIEKIIKELFESNRSSSQKYSFYVAEFLLAVIAQPARKIREKKVAAQALWFLTHGYDYKAFKTQRYLIRSRTFRFDRDICSYVMAALTNIAKGAEIDFSIFVRKVIETPFKPDKLEKLENNKTDSAVPTKPAEKPQEESSGKRFYVRTLMEKKPKLYALAKIQERSEKALEKPSILVDFRGIDKEKDCEESYVRKLREKAENFKSTNISDQIQNLRNFDAEQATKRTFADFVDRIVLFKGEFKQEQEKTTRAELLDTINTKAKEINEANTSDLLEVLDEFLVNPNKNVLLIQGDAGAGKTLLLRLFEQRLWKKYNMLFKADSKNRNRLPLRIALSEVRSFDKAVDEFLIHHGCDAEAVFDIKKEPAVILFDGYDEINQYINLYNLNKLETWRDVKVIFTSRKENLTSLKEDYLLCFTPGTDKSKVLSYSIQPVNEDQIRKYFNAQVSENENKIKRLEDELKVLNGTESGDVTISKTVQREVTWLQKFPTSEHFNCMCELLGTLEDHLPEIEDLQEEIAAFKENGVEACQLTEVFEKQIAELKNLTDKAKIEGITKKIESGLTEEINQIEKFVDSCLESLENNVSTYHSSNYNIKNYIKRLKKLTNLKRASHLGKKIAEQVEQSISESETTISYTSYAEAALTEAKSFEERTSLEGLKKQKLAEEIEKFRTFNKKLKSSALPSDKENAIIFNPTEAETYLTKIQELPQSSWEKIAKNWKKLYEKMEEFKTLEREVYRLVTGQEYKSQQEQQEDLKPEVETKPEEEVKPKEESKPEDPSKPEEEVKPEEEPKPEESEPEGESKPEDELKPEEESRPEESKPEGVSKPKEVKPKEESTTIEQSKPEELKPEGESKPKDDPQPPQGQADEVPSAKKNKIDYEKLKEKVAKMKEAFDKMKEICKEFKLFDVEECPTFIAMDSNLFYDLLWNKNDEQRGITESEMYEIQSQTYIVESGIRCYVSMHTEIESVIRNVEIYIEYINPLCYHSEAGSLIQKFTEKIEEVQENLDIVKGHKVDHNEGSEVVQILQKQITSLKGVSSYLDTQRIIQKLDDIINDIKALENESKAVKEGTTDEAIRVKALLKQIKDLKKFTDSDNLESIIQKFKDIITSPFMLKMLLQTLLKFPKSTANRAELYRLFSTIHFEREKDKLLQTEKIPPKFNVIDSFYQYSKDLAVNMFIKKVASLQAKSNGYKVRGVVETVKKLQWSRFFDDDDIITKLARRGAQIIEDDGTVRFIHKSILEYFAARQFYDEIVDYNPDNQEEASEPCLNKGVLVDNETAVYHFMKNIAETDILKNDKDLTIFDKKLLETLSSPVLQKDFGNDFNKNLLYPNMFLLVLMRKNLAKKLVGQKEDSPASMMINNILKWMFTETTDSARRFVDMLSKIKAFDGELFVTMNHLLKIYYHHATKEHGGLQFKDRFVTSKKKLQIKVAVTDEFSGSSNTTLRVKDKTVFKTPDKIEYCWILDGKLFIHDSQDNIVVLKSDNNKYLAMATDKNKDTANAKPEDQTGDYVVVETEHPWDVKECKWILRMNQHTKTQFEMMSLTDSTKILYGYFDKLEEYNKFWDGLCETDIHLGSISDTSYQCKTCNIVSSQILCKNCIDKCHKGHEIIEYGASGGYCDCRFLGCCQLATGCTVRFPDGYRNPVMFKCTQCPNEKRKIMCLACKKHHEKEHQNFEKVVDADGCECDCPSNKCKIISYAQDRNYLYYLTNTENNNNQENDGEDDDDEDSNPNN